MIKNKYKLISIGQIDDALQLTINAIQNGKTSYNKHEVITLLKTIYNAILRQATQNAEIGLYIPVEENDGYVH